MIDHVASLSIVGEEKAAEQLALRLAAFINRKFPGANARILRNFDGKLNRLHLVDTYDSIAAWEAARDSNDQDPQWQSLIGSGDGLFDFNSLEGHFYQVVTP